MRKIILGLVATAAIAAPLALASSASANVAVDNGTGFVGKGDVQTALGYKNDSALQADAANIKFASTGTVTEVGGFQWGCSDGTTQRGYVTTQVSAMTQTVNATANRNPQGKVSDGFNLTGVNPGVKGAVLSSTTDTGLGYGVCVGSYRNTSIGFFADEPVLSAGDLTVSGNGKTGVALPNTPVVEVAPVV